MNFSSILFPLTALMMTGVESSSSVDFSSAQAAVREHAKGFLSARQAEMMHRSLQLSDQCKTETEAIFADTTYFTAYATLQANVENAFDPNSCTETGTNQLSCDFDFSSFDTAELKSACASLNGQDTTSDFYLKCDVSAEGQSGAFTINYKNVYDCLGASCDPSNVSSELEKTFDELKDLLSAFGMTCEAGAGSGVGTLTASTAIIGSMAGLLFLAMI